MAHQWWSRPVTVETRKTGERLSIATTERAAQYLLEGWPTIEEGTAFKAAKQALVEESDRKIDAARARELFLAALKEGEIFVYDE